MTVEVDEQEFSDAEHKEENANENL